MHSMVENRILDLSLPNTAQDNVFPCKPEEFYGETMWWRFNKIDKSAQFN